MCRQLPNDWLSRTLIRSWVGFEDGRAFRYEVRECPTSGIKVKARMPIPKASTQDRVDNMAMGVV